jgi:hypothetical protein
VRLDVHPHAVERAARRGPPAEHALRLRLHNGATSDGWLRPAHAPRLRLRLLRLLLLVVTIASGLRACLVTLASRPGRRAASAAIDVCLLLQPVRSERSRHALAWLERRLGCRCGCCRRCGRCIRRRCRRRCCLLPRLVLLAALLGRRGPWLCAAHKVTHEGERASRGTQLDRV